MNECPHAFPPFSLSLVPLVGYKPSTMDLRVKCSTTVLLGHSQKWMKAYLKFSDQSKIRCKREKIMGKHVDILSRAHTWSSKAFLSFFLPDCTLMWTFYASSHIFGFAPVGQLIWVKIRNWRLLITDKSGFIQWLSIATQQWYNQRFKTFWERFRYNFQLYVSEVFKLQIL